MTSHLISRGNKGALLRRITQKRKVIVNPEKPILRVSVLPAFGQLLTILMLLIFVTSNSRKRNHAERTQLLEIMILILCLQSQHITWLLLPGFWQIGHTGMWAHEDIARM